MTGGDELGELLDREQLLGGAPARRAATLLFLIETRTARLVAQSRQRLERSLTDETGQERALAFVEAFALARETAVQPTVHELERQAERWAPLVPRNPRLQAALARRVREKYRFTAAVAPGIQKALGLDEPEVRDAYQALYREPIESVFAATMTRGERLRWTWTALAKRLENLPSFWTAYSLTLTETLGASILALPIALASLGPLPGIAIIVVLGIVNVLTVWLMAEAVARSGPMRYGNAFIGRLVEGYLGRRGSLGTSALLAAFSFIALPVYYVGVGATLEDATSVPGAAWVAALFLATLFFVRRGSLNATVAAAIAVGAVNLVLILALAGVAFAHAERANLLHANVPFANGRPFDASVVAVVFGVVLMAYFGHLSAALAGSLVLERDPSGRSLIRGCAAAMATAIAVYCIFVLAANGAVGVGGFAGVTGTALGPLGDVVGWGVYVLGSTFVLLALGMASIIEALTLFKLAQERIPWHRPRVVVLPRRRGHLLFRSRGEKLRARLTYRGPGEDGFWFSLDVERDGRLEHREIRVSTHGDLLGESGSSRHRLVLELIEADARRARVAVTTTLRVAYEGELEGAGLDLAEVLELSEAEAALVAALARAGPAGAATVAGRIGRSERETLVMVEELVARGLVAKQQTPAGPLFSARMAPRRARRSAVWDALAAEPQGGRPAPVLRPAHGVPTGSRGGVLLGPRGRFVLAILPLLVAFAVGEWFVITGVGSFAGLLSFLGVIVVSLLAGLLPVLLLVSSRRKGEYGLGSSYDFLGRPFLLMAVYLLFLGALVAHGLVIWDDRAARVCALAAAAAMLATPAVLVRGGALARRLTVELRDDQRSGTARFAFLSAGRPVSGAVRLEYEDGEERPGELAGEVPAFESLRRAVFTVPRVGPAPLEEVKVWVHRVTPEGESESLPATARVRNGGHVEAADLSLSRGEAVFPLVGDELEIEIALRESEVRAT